MKTVTGRIISAEPISLTKAAKLLSDFASADNNEASQDVSAYLQRAAAAFTELKSIHREIKSASLKETKPRSDVRRDRNPTGESDGRANNGIDVDLVENGEEIRDRKSETVSDHDEIKEDKKEKKKSKKKKEKDVVVDEKVKEKLEEEEKSEERKEKKKKKKSRKNKEEDVVDEKVDEKLEEEEEKSEERKEKKKKKRKSDGEIGSEEKKSKKRKKSKEIDG